MSYLFCRVCNSLFKTSLKRIGEVPEGLFELNLASATPFPVICTTGFLTRKNLLYSFPNSAHLQEIPKKEEVDGLIAGLEETMEDMIDSGKYLADPNAYVQTILTWMFFLVVRRCFDFNLYLRYVNPNDEVFKRQLNLWEFLTTVISKVWFFKLLIELRSRSERYCRVLENKKISLNGFQDAEMDRLLSELRGGDYGVPVYAHSGFFRKLETDSILSE